MTPPARLQSSKQYGSTSSDDTGRVGAAVVGIGDGGDVVG